MVFWVRRVRFLHTQSEYSQYGKYRRRINLWFVYPYALDRYGLNNNYYVNVKTLQINNVFL